MRDFQAEWMAAMRRGDFASAWAVSDAVLAARDPAARDDPTLPYHLRWVWDGRPYIDRHVLIRCYHGFGDTLQFARYLPLLRRHVRSLTLEVQPALLPLLRAVPGADRIVPFVLDRPLPQSDCDLEIMELPHALRVPPDDVPPVQLAVTAEERNGIGLRWLSGGWDRDRDMPAALMASLAHGAVSLQTETTRLPVLNPVGCPTDIAGTARLIASLRLVITVDTMVAHLAGSLGRPTWLLLKHEADWRWMEQRADSPWYPSMRLFRQRTAGDWQEVMDRVLKAAC